MAEYDCCDPRLAPSSSVETAVSISQALRNSTSESMWEGWTQSPPVVSQCTLTEQLQQQLGGGDYSRLSTSAKSGSSYQHDLLSSWLMSGYQTVGGLHQQQQHPHGGEEGSGIPAMYNDEFSRMNICPSTSSEYHGGAACPPATAAGEGSSDVSHQLYDAIQTCSSSVQRGKNSAGQTGGFGKSSAHFLPSTPRLDHSIEAEPYKSDVSDNQKMSHQMNATTELSSRASSSSPSSGLNSYGQTIQQHLGAPFDNHNYWPSPGSTVAITSLCSQRSDCGEGGGARSAGQEREDQQPNTSCDSIILHHQQQQQQLNSRNGYEGDDALFHHPGTDLTPDQMYSELHGLLSKSLDAAAPCGVADHQHQQLAICGMETSAASGSYHGDPLNWTQFSPSFSGPSSQVGGFIGIQDFMGRTMFDGSTPDSVSTATQASTRREESSPSSASTAMSTIQNCSAADLTRAASLSYRSSPADLDCSEMGLQQQRKRPLSRGTEQVGESGISAEDSAKRSCIVRCLWEQNIAELQLANLPSDQHRNLWQLQSQALLGRLPGSNFLTGGSSSSNSGSIQDMNTAVGPALNTNGRPRARRGSATDPQSVYARHRRERINDRLKVLQHLVPNGAKVDIVTMLEEAINYVKFLQLQVRLLSSDELWIYAPTTYNGVDVSMGMHAGLLNQQA